MTLVIVALASFIAGGAAAAVAAVAIISRVIPLTLDRGIQEGRRIAQARSSRDDGAA